MMLDLLFRCALSNHKRIRPARLRIQFFVDAVHLGKIMNRHIDHIFPGQLLIVSDEEVLNRDPVIMNADDRDMIGRFI